MTEEQLIEAFNKWRRENYAARAGMCPAGEEFALFCAGYKLGAACSSPSIPSEEGRLEFARIILGSDRGTNEDNLPACHYCDALVDLDNDEHIEHEPTCPVLKAAAVLQGDSDAI